ncbi:unnamed protein product [Musa banksii]
MVKIRVRLDCQSQSQPNKDKWNRICEPNSRPPGRKDEVKPSYMWSSINS